MKEIKCLQCGKPVKQTSGKRKKEYCGSTCRSLHWKEKQQAGKPKRGPGRPPKIEPFNPSNLQKELEEITVKQAKKTQEVTSPVKPKKGDAPGEFMGHKIPSNLKGIDLTIWKAEVKEKSK